MRLNRPVSSAALLASAIALTVAALATACSAPTPNAPGGGPTAPAAPPGTPGAGQPAALANCTKSASDPAGARQALSSALPGDRICLTGNVSGERLVLRNSGTPDRPITILGGGRAVSSGISIEASNVVVDGLQLLKPEAPGASLNGTNIRFTNNTIRSPRDNDGDGIRFWGRDLVIERNTISDTVGQDKRHADCMQTFATDEKRPPSQNVRIEANRCEDIDNICLIAEGPESTAGDGIGKGNSVKLIFRNNYCENRAGQAVYLDDFEEAQIIDNEIAGAIKKAFALKNDSLGAVIRGNRLNPAIGYEVGMDDSSQERYQGPEPGGAP